MSSIFRIAAALELGLTGLENCVHSMPLPVGGGQLEQIAISFIIAFVIEEFGEIFSPLIKRAVAWLKPTRNETDSDEQAPPGSS